MWNVFSYARDKIKKKYESRSDFASEEIKKLHESWELLDIDNYEEKAKTNCVAQITYRIKAFWYVQPYEEKVYIWLIIGAILFEVLVVLYTMNDTPLNNIIINISKDFFFWFKALGIAFVCTLLFDKHLIKRKLFYIVWVSVLLLSIPQMPVLFGYETTQIGDFYEAKEYTEKYYVLMSRQPQEKENRKVYTLPADIERSLEYYYTEDVYEDYYLQEHGGYDVYSQGYYIRKLHFPNGGYLTFDNMDDSLILVGIETEVIDYHEDTYYITLTSEKVNKE